MQFLDKKLSKWQQRPFLIQKQFLWQKAKATHTGMLLPEPREYKGWTASTDMLAILFQALTKIVQHWISTINYKHDWLCYTEVHTGIKSPPYRECQQQILSHNVKEAVKYYLTDFFCEGGTPPNKLLGQLFRFWKSFKINLGRESPPPFLATPKRQADGKLCFGLQH